MDPSTTLPNINIPSWLKWLGLGAGGAVAASQIPKIIRGIIGGIIFIGIAFVLIFTSVNSIPETSQDVKSIPLQNATNIKSDTRGLVKAYQSLTTASPVTLTIPLARCTGENCKLETSEEAYSQPQLLYYEVNYERFQVIEKETTKTENGKTVTTIEYKEDWVDQGSEEKWASNIKLGNLEINPLQADVRIDMKSTTIENVTKQGLPQLDNYGRVVSTEVGKLRAKVTYLPLDSREYIVVGEVRNGLIDRGELFILTDKTETELVANLAGQENFMRWIVRIIAFIFLTIGLTSILSPVLAFTDLIPVVGKAARSLAGLVSAVLAALIILLTTILIQLWWVFLILLVLGVIGYLYLSFHFKKHGQPKSFYVRLEEGS